MMMDLSLNITVMGAAVKDIIKAVLKRGHGVGGTRTVISKKRVITRRA
jgi:hypothetical protein